MSEQQLIIQIDLTDLGEDPAEDPGVVNEILARLSKVEEPWWKGHSTKAPIRDASGKTIGRFIITKAPSLYFREGAVGIYQRGEG